MDVRLFLTVFATVFVAELGDKTQVATMLFAADPEKSKPVILVASAAALILSSAVGVAAGTLLSRYLDQRILSWVAGSGFILIGVWTLIRA